MRISDWSSDVCSSDLDIAINRFALRLHGPAFISADKFAYAAHVLRVVAPERCRRQDGAVLGLWHFQLVSADQRTMDQKVRIAPDGRSEMAVASKLQTELAPLAGAVIGLSLRSENLLHKLRPVRG